MAYDPILTWKDKEDPSFNEASDPSIDAACMIRIETGISDAHDHMADTDIHFSAAERTKLGGIEAGATTDQTASEIVALINASEEIINDANIASSIARDSEVPDEIDFDNYSETLSFENNDWILIQSATDGTIKKIRAGNLLR